MLEVWESEILQKLHKLSQTSKTVLTPSFGRQAGPDEYLSTRGKSTPRDIDTTGSRDQVRSKFTIKRLVSDQSFGRVEAEWNKAGLEYPVMGVVTGLVGVRLIAEGYSGRPGLPAKRLQHQLFQSGNLLNININIYY